MADTVQGHEAVGGATKRGAPDPSVKLPAGVKAAADRANELSAQAKVIKEQNAAAGKDEPIGDSISQQVPAPASVASSVTMANFDPANPTPPRDVAPPPAPQPPTPQTSEDWEHQFRSLKGRYEREAEEKRRLNQQIVDMQRLMAQVGPPPVAPEGSGVRFNVAPPPPGQRVTQKEVEEYGSELMDVVGRRAAEVYEPILSQLANELNQVKRQVGGVQNAHVFDARVKMYEDLAREVPGWEQINTSPQFAQWLDQVDPISRQPRRAFLNVAHNSNQTGQVIDIFKTFLATSNGGGDSQSHQAAPAATSAPAQQFDLRALAAPGRAKTGQTTVPPEKPIFNAADISRFYQDKTQGKYVGREDEMARIESALFEAGREGRIIRR